MSDETRPIAVEEYMQLAPGSEPSWGQFAPNVLQRLLISMVRNSPLRRGLFRRTMTRLIKGFSGKPLDVEFRNCAFRLRGQNNLIEYGILLSPDYNAADIDFLIDGAPDGASFVDVGSNIGLYSLPLARKAGDAGTVLAIDANPLMASQLRSNAEHSNLNNIRMFACGVSDTEGAARLTVRKNDVAIVAMEEAEDGDIPIRTLASIVSETGLTSICGLKIDIEGHEDRALVPFLDSAPTSLLPKKIVIEHPLPDEDYSGCAAAFERHGYRLTARTRNNSLYELGGDETD